MKKLTNFVIFFLKANWEWKIPRKTKLLVYDATGYSRIKDFINSFDHKVLHSRGEVLNFYIFLFSLRKLTFWKGKIISAYIETAIELYNPNIVITLIDNNKEFYILKSKFPYLKTMFIQNGWRGEQADIFETLKINEKYFVDDMFVFGRNIAKKYGEYIQGKFHLLGSLMNNKISILRKEKTIDLLFISQYSGEDLSDSGVFFKDKFGVTFKNRDFFFADGFVLNFLNSYVKKNKLKLTILLRTSDEREVNFYNELLDNTKFEFIGRSSIIDSYTALDISKCVVFIDSTLGYEAIGRNARVASFSIRNITMKNNATKFGWPGKYPDQGFFWTNIADNSIFNDILDRVLACTNSQWKAQVGKFGNELIVFNSDNIILRDHFTSILAEFNKV